MTALMRTKSVVGMRRGKVTRRKKYHRPAPMRAAASCSCGDTDCSAARQKIMKKPACFQTVTTMRQGSAVLRVPSQLWLGRGKRPRIWSGRAQHGGEKKK